MSDLHFDNTGNFGSLKREETVQFLPSQVGRSNQTPVAWTGDPVKLLLNDAALLLKTWTTIPGIFRPIRLGSAANRWDELYPSFPNIVALTLHLVLLIAQTGFLISLPFLLAVPSWLAILYIAIFYACNCAVSRIINGRNNLRLEPSNDIVFEDKHDDEFWIYLNGVSIGHAWLQSNVDRLSLTFRRRVLGVHNPTDGVIFDLIQCLVQRNFCFSTPDIREAYASIKDALLKEHIKKVVFILHSQGGIEGGLIIDWLLAEMPQNCLQKLEVYTFASAANHFCNPVRSSGDPEEPGFNRKHHKLAIRHVEHYAHGGDFVSKFGVINYTGVQNRFMGRLFLSPNSGHLLNAHYLFEMFPLDSEERCAETNDFMEMEVDVKLENLCKEGREKLEDSLSLNRSARRDSKIAYVGDVNSPISPVHRTLSLMGYGTHPGRPLKVKDFSRLWQYRNGRSPEDEEVETNGVIPEDEDEEEDKVKAIDLKSPQWPRA